MSPSRASVRRSRTGPGGTRIGACLAEFNRRWSRRLLGQGAIVLLISDGLDSEVGDGLAQEMDRLHKSCRRLIWLNPLLRYEGFEARPAGIRAMLPYVDEFLPVHNLESLKQLGGARSRGARCARPRSRAVMAPGRRDTPSGRTRHMEMNGSRDVPASVGSDLERAQRSRRAQGVHRRVRVDRQVSDNEYQVAMTARVGPVSAKFNGRIVLSDIVAAERRTRSASTARAAPPALPAAKRRSHWRPRAAVRASTTRRRRRWAASWRRSGRAWSMAPRPRLPTISSAGFAERLGGSGSRRVDRSSGDTARRAGGRDEEACGSGLRLPPHHRGDGDLLACQTRPER